jgi:hypothetical protein
MKVIDLLNKIANGEEVPKYIKYRNWNNNSFDKMLVCKENIFYKLDQLEIYLNDEVEIIEEDKEIEEISFKRVGEGIPLIDYDSIEDKINELVKAVNELKKGK